MSNRMLTVMTLILVAGMGSLLLLNYSAPVEIQEKIGFLSPNDVEGSATEKNGKLWTLNFEQQNNLIALLNRSAPFNEEPPTETHNDKLTFDRLVIYRFNRTDVIITPVSIIDDRLLFSSSEWNLNGLMIENFPGEIQNLLAETYDN